MNAMSEAQSKPRNPAPTMDQLRSELARLTELSNALWLERNRTRLVFMDADSEWAQTERARRQVQAQIDEIKEP